jgi:hypothetical protein
MYKKNIKTKIFFDERTHRLLPIPKQVTSKPA